MIRSAKLEDFEAIKNIEEQLTIDTSKITQRDYRSNIQRNGFLVQNSFTIEKFAD